MTITRLKKSQTWWWEHQVQQRLIKYVHALLIGRHYKVILTEEGTGYTDFLNKIIQANPVLFIKESVEIQFKATKAILGHEAGHALFTEEWPEAAPSNLLNLTNALEDERIERCITTLYPGLVDEFDLLGNLEIKAFTTLPPLENPENKVLSACLRWRWLWDKKDGEKTLIRINGFNSEAIKFWEEIKPLVETSWSAWGTVKVIELANRILDILKLPKERETIKRELVRGVSSPVEDMGDFSKDRGDEKPLPYPKGPADLEPFEPEIHVATLRDYPSGNISSPAPYTSLEERATAPAYVLSESLKRIEPEQRMGSHDWKGRYNTRQELRTPDTPNVFRTLVGESGKNTTIIILVDRSGSIAGFNDAVQLALMICYLAAIKIHVPVGVIFFGDDSDCGELVYMLGPVSSVLDEAVLSGIAGFAGCTGSEFLNWGLELAKKELLTRPEEIKRLIVIHDGQPVYNGDKGNDFVLSQSTLHNLPSQGITPIGVYLGNDGGCIKKLKKLFDHLVITNGDELPQKLGNMFRSIA